MTRLQEARTIPPEQLFERRKQAVALFKKGMLRKDIAPIVGVGRNKAGEWVTAWQEGGIRALKVGKAGAPKGSGLRLNHFESLSGARQLKSSSRQEGQSLVFRAQRKNRSALSSQLQP